MRTRHKPPTLVSMWMLDVFCCALGCVTLLWLLNTREATEQSTRARSALELLDRSESDLKATKAELLATRAEFDRTRRKLNADIEALGRTLKVINIALVPALLTLGVLALWLWRRRRRA